MPYILFQEKATTFRRLRLTPRSRVLEAKTTTPTRTLMRATESFKDSYANIRTAKGLIPPPEISRPTKKHTRENTLSLVSRMGAAKPFSRLTGRKKIARPLSCRL